MRGRESGSAAVEAVLVAPVLLLLLALLVGGGALVREQAALRAVAREAARIAVTAPDARTAVGLARARARSVAAGYGLNASHLRVAVLTGAFRRGGDVTVAAHYLVDLSGLPSFGLISSSAKLRATHVEHIELYRSR